MGQIQDKAGIAGRTGIFGGTFDPIHLGHLIAAQEIQRREHLDTIVFIPSAIPPHKAYDGMATPDDRWQMVSRAIQGNPRFRASSIELEREGTSYTVDTLHALRTQLDPQIRLYLIVGADNVSEIRTWCRPEEIVRLCTVLVASRPYADFSEADGQLMQQMRFVTTPLIEISSTDIRNRVRRGDPIHYLVPRSIEQYILDRSLYT